MADKLSKNDLARRSVEVFIDGIPAIALIDTYIKVRPNPRADNPYDYHGYIEVEFTLYDRKGYRAKWLDDLVERRGLWENIEEQVILEWEDDV